MLPFPIYSAILHNSACGIFLLNIIIVLILFLYFIIFQITLCSEEFIKILLKPVYLLFFRSLINTLCVTRLRSVFCTRMITKNITPKTLFYCSLTANPSFLGSTQQIHCKLHSEFTAPQIIILTRTKITS